MMMTLKYNIVNTQNNYNTAFTMPHGVCEHAIERSRTQLPGGCCAVTQLSD